MATITETEGAVKTEQRLQSLKDEVVRSFWKKGGRACVADLASELPTSARELTPIVESLEKEGVVRKVSDSGDPRKYKAPHQTVYELSR
jgi:hypothetical protein